MNYFRSILFIFFLFVILPHGKAYGTSQTLLKCLGMQEEVLHKHKISIQAVNLHQQFITEAINFQSLKVKDSYISQICNYRSGLKSFIFLKLFLKNKGQIFTKRLSKKENLALYEKIMIHIQNYISLTQNISPNTDCLFVDSAAVSKFLFRVLYLRESLSAKKILDDNKLGLKVLSELENFPQKVKHCSPPDQEK